MKKSTVLLIDPNKDWLEQMKAELSNYSEIEVIVFARQYKQFADNLFVENAVSVVGTVSTEEGEAPKVLLSSLEVLHSNTELASKGKEQINAPKKRIYIKVNGLTDERITAIYRLAALNRGDTSIVLYDVSTKKYSSMKDISIAPTDKVLERLTLRFGSENLKYQ